MTGASRIVASDWSFRTREAARPGETSPPPTDERGGQVVGRVGYVLGYAANE